MDVHLLRKSCFIPVFKDNTVCDENGTPYAVDNQNASKWGNGYIPRIQDTKITEYDDKLVIKYRSMTISLLSALRQKWKLMF